MGRGRVVAADPWGGGGVGLGLTQGKERKQPWRLNFACAPVLLEGNPALGSIL